jgi:membrane associated rhomboid family serine protease
MTCYRHPDREAYVRCQRCERFICPECQIEASVGFLCPDDAGGTVTQINRRRTRAARVRQSGPRPAITLTLIGINVAIWLLQIMPGSLVTDLFAYVPQITAVQPWRMITAGFVHNPNLFLQDGVHPEAVLHILLNMYSLYIFGQVLEPMLGRARFAALYLISLFGGSVGVLWLANPDGWVVGASGAIFGLMAAYFVILRTLGQNSSQMLGLIAINLVFGFFSSGVSWQGHVGGLVTGGIVALILANTRQLSQQAAQRLGLVSVTILLVLLTVFRANLLGL